MNCNDIRELMPDLAAGLSESTAEASEHLRGCSTCAEQLESFRKTMALLEEWQAPEPSPYFDTRLQARLREEMARTQTQGWLHWFRKPILAISFAVIMVASATLVRINGNKPVPTPVAQAEPGTAVGDLQALDKNDDLYSSFDVLDDLQIQQDITANP
jgi:anti-sigma factor RsiW